MSTRKELGQSALYIWPKAISCYQACFIPTSVDLQATCKSLWSTPCNDREMLYIEKPFKMTALSNIGESVNTVLNVFSFCAPHLRLVTLHLWRRKYFDHFTTTSYRINYFLFLYISPKVVGLVCPWLHHTKCLLLTSAFNGVITVCRFLFVCLKVINDGKWRIITKPSCLCRNGKHSIVTLQIILASNMYFTSLSIIYNFMSTPFYEYNRLALTRTSHSITHRQSV